ncbi:TniQ family protein [Streptomyces sp. NPDC058232]|uniref:TniQ family protein n=1 Tax=Streptomyces sp. NPDC058232 TaxID=3346393 RepID=UPI0036E9CAA8
MTAYIDVKHIGVELTSPLPRKIHRIRGETTGSYVWRLAHANGKEPLRLLHMMGRGQVGGLRPASGELYMNISALRRLSGLIGVSATRLQESLGLAHVPVQLGRFTAAAWQWLPRETHQLHVVKACRLCAAAKGADYVAYVWSEAPWQVCLRHRVWQDDRAEERSDWHPPPGHLAMIVAAHRQRLVFERRLGPMGRFLFADAYSACAYWWNEPRLTLPVWIDRQRSFADVDYSDPFPALQVIYPEVVKLARLLAQHEQRRMRGTLDQRQWWQEARGVFRLWGSPLELEEVSLPLTLWTSRHGYPPERGKWRGQIRRALMTPPPQRPPDSRLPLNGPHQDDSLEQPLEHLTCLPFTYRRVDRAERAASTRPQLRPFIDEVGTAGWEALPPPGQPGALNPRKLQ